MATALIQSLYRATLPSQVRDTIVKIENGQNEVYLSSTNLTARHARELARVINSTEPGIKRFIMWDVDTDAPALMIIGEALCRCANLQLVCLYVYGVADDVRVVVIDNLLRNCTDLKDVVMSCDDPDRGIEGMTAAGVNTFARAIQQSRSLKSVSFYNTRITDVGMCAIVAAVARSHAVERVVLGHAAERQRPLIIAVIIARVYRRVVVLYGPSPRSTPITRFLRRDGDNAIMHRVVRFMLRRQ